MSLMPFPHYDLSAGADAEMTAGEDSYVTGTTTITFTGYSDSDTATNIFGRSAIGSITPSTALDGDAGGILTQAFGAFEANLVVLKDASFLESLDVDGTNYSATYSYGVYAAGVLYEIYTFGPASALFTDTVTYDINYYEDTTPTLFQFFAGQDVPNGIYGYLSSTANTDLGGSGAVGTFVKGLTTADGGTVEGIYCGAGANSGTVLIKGGSASLASMDLNATAFALTYSTSAGGYDFYTWNNTQGGGGFFPTNGVFGAEFS